MASQDGHEWKPHSIFAYSVLAIFVVGLIVALVSIYPLYNRLLEGMDDSLQHIAKINAKVIDEYLRRVEGITQQITSRTQIRRKLEAYNRGEVTLDEMVEFSHDMLADALRSSDEAIGITRLDRSGRQVVQVGSPLPKGTPWPIPSDQSKEALTFGPILVNGAPHILVGAHIFDEGNAKVGTDIVLFTTDFLRTILVDYEGLGETGETVLGVQRKSQIELLLPLRSKTKKIAAPVSLDSILGSMIAKSIKKESGIVSVEDETGKAVAYAYAPLQHAPWGIVVKMDTDELYSPVNRQIILIGTVIFILILLGTSGFILLLRPLTSALDKELKDRKRAEIALRGRIEFEELIAKLSSQFVNIKPDNTDAALNDALRVIGEFEQVDRSYIFLFHDDGITMDNTHEWCAESIEPQIDTLKGIRVDEEFPWFAKTIRRQEVFHVPLVAELPPEAAAEKAIFEAQDIKSLISVPMVSSGKLVGFVGFDAVRARKVWDDKAIALLRIVGEIFANTLERKQVGEALRESESRYEDLYEHAPDMYISIDAATAKVLRCNQTLTDALGYSKAEIIGRPVFDLYHPDSLAGAHEAFNLFAASGVVRDAEMQLRRKDGTKITVSMNATAIRDEHGQIIASHSSWRDTTLIKQAETALREREAQFRTLIDYAPDAVAVFDVDSGYFIDVNPEMEKIFGFTREQWLRMSPFDFSPAKQPDGRSSGEAGEEIIQRVMQGEPQRFEWTHLNTAGEEVLCDIHLVRLPAPGKRLLRANLVDITARKRAEQSLRKIASGVSAQTGEVFFHQMVMQLASLFNADFAFIALFDERESNTMNTLAVCAHGANAENMSYSLTDTPCANVVGKSTCTYPSGVQQMFPRDKFLADMGAESYCGTPLFDSAGKPLGLISVIDSKPMSDTTRSIEILEIFGARAGAEMERIRAERRLGNAQQKLALHAQQTPLGVIEWNTNFEVVEWNPSAEKFFGFSRAEALGRHAKELIVPPSVVAHVDDVWHALLENKGGTRSTNENVTKDGRTIMCEWYNTPLVMDDGQVIGVASLVADISDHVQAQAELARHRDHLEELVAERTTELAAVNKELESFSYSVSHDLRAPLRAIDGFSQALLEDYADAVDDTGKDYLRRTRKASQRMAELIDDLLLLSRVTRQEMRLEAMDLSTSARDICESLEGERKKSKMNYIIQDHLTTEGDPRLLKIALMNLLNNAVKFTGKKVKPRVEFGMENHGDEKIYYVRDNGVGFHMQHADKLFGPFQRLHKADEFPGTGIGLATVARIIHRHGGRVWAEAAVNRGATFYFTLGQ